MGYSCKQIEYDSVTDYVLMIDNDNPNGVSSGNKDKIYNVQVCVNWNFPVIDAFGTWRFTGKTELIKNAVELR